MVDKKKTQIGGYIDSLSLDIIEKGQKLDNRLSRWEFMVAASIDKAKRLGATADNDQSN